MRKKTSQKGETCEECKVKVKVIDQSRRLLERDEMGDMGETEASEYEAAGIGGDSEHFEINQVTYECPKCHDTKTVEFL
ncbi:MAG: hypothetical protein ABR887_06130 [Methanoregulaceae archaeon]|jgi:Zn finger protein HypA/HybF involved in hydrogenase expression